MSKENPKGKPEILNHLDVATNITEKLLKGDFGAFTELSDFLCFTENGEEHPNELAFNNWRNSLPERYKGTLYSLICIVDDLYEFYGPETEGLPSTEIETFNEVLKRIGFLMRDGVVLQHEDKDYSMYYLGDITQQIEAFEEKLEKSTEPKSTWIRLN